MIAVYVCMYPLNGGSAGKRLRDVIREFPNATGIITDDDTIALTAVQVLTELGIRVPEDLSIAVSVPSGLHEQVSMPYTSVDANLSDSHLSVDMLVDRINRPDAPQVLKLIPMPLFDRGSVAWVG